jgi:phenylacetate-CoA ligase
MTAKKKQLFEHDDRLERLSVAGREKILDDKLHKLVTYAYKNAPAVRERFDQAGIKPKSVHSIQDLEALPILRKDDLIRLQKENPPFGGYLAVPIAGLGRVFQSPGPIYDPERRGRSAQSDFGKGQIVINTWSYHITPGGFIVEDMLRNMGCTVFPAGPGNTDLILQVMYDLRAAGFVGAPSFLNAVIRKAEEKGYDFRNDFNLRWAMVFGEMGGDVLRKMFTEKYGIECIWGDAYATADLGFVATSCEKNCGMHVTTDAIIEIVDPHTGKTLGPNEVGEIVVTPFDEVYPLIRFGTGDLSCLQEEVCACGRTTARLPKIMGRSGDAVRVRAMFVHPNQTDQVAAKYPEIAAYQLVVTRADNRDNMVMSVELCREPADKEKWLANLDKDFRDICKVKCDEVCFVPAGTMEKGAKKIVDKRTY